MSNRLIQGPFETVDVWVFNNAANVAIERGQLVVWDSTTTAHKFDPNAAYVGDRGPLEGAVTIEISDVKKAATSATAEIVGVAQRRIGPGEWGFVRRSGMGVARVTGTTGGQTHLDAYGASTTVAGDLQTVTVGTVDLIACQLGTAATTVATGDLRSVFINIPEIDVPAMLQHEGRPMGTWVTSV